MNNPNATATAQQSGGYLCHNCNQFIPYLSTILHSCVFPAGVPSTAQQGWRCSCAAFVVVGEEHRCFYRDALGLLERIAKALEAK